MLVRCHWCQGQFEPERTGRQRCPKCGSELDVKEPPPLPPLAEFADEPEPPRWPTPAPGQRGWDGPPPPGLPPYGGGGSPFDDGEPSPWERSEELGMVQAIKETWLAATFHPTAFFRKLKARPIGPAFLYGWLMGGAGMGFQAVWMSVGGFTDDDFGVAVTAPVFFLLGLISVPFIIGFNALTIHLGCMLLGINRRGFEATFRSVAYAQSPQILALVPLVGSGVAGLWTLIVTVIAVREMQEATTTQSFLAVFLLPFAVVLVVVLLMVGAILSTVGDLPRW